MKSSLIALACALVSATPAMAEEAAAPDAIVVTGTRYTIDIQTTGTKTDTPLLDLPMAVSVVTRDVIDDRQIRTAIEAVKNVSGVQAPVYQFYDQFLIRGFDSGYGATWRNG